MKESKAYCIFNEQGYCKTCGQTQDPKEPELNGKWPTNTWFQNRRKLVLARELEEK